MRVTIITPTTGNPLFQKTLDSINRQVTTAALEHLIVIDGPEHQTKVSRLLKEVPAAVPDLRQVVALPYATGKDGYLGHRIYAAFGQLVRGDYCILLDEDNFLEPNHVQSFVNLVQQRDFDWLYCLRRVVNTAGEWVCNDNCESLGYMQKVFYNKESEHNDFLIDTSCYFLKKSVLAEVSPIWNQKGTADIRNPDRKFAKLLMENYRRFECTRQYSLNYTVENRANSVGSKLFINGNRLTELCYKRVPWQDPVLFLAYKTPQATTELLKNIYSAVAPKWADGEQMLARLGSRLLLLNAFTSFVPFGAHVYCVDCELPRADLTPVSEAELKPLVAAAASPVSASASPVSAAAAGLGSISSATLATLPAPRRQKEVLVQWILPERITPDERTPVVALARQIRNLVVSRPNTAYNSKLSLFVDDGTVSLDEFQHLSLEENSKGVLYLGSDVARVKAAQPRPVANLTRVEPKYYEVFIADFLNSIQ